MNKDNFNIVIREAQESDAQSLIDCTREIFKTTKELGYEPEDANTSLSDKKHTISMFSKVPNAILLVAVKDGMVIGDLSFRGGQTRQFRHVGELGVQVLEEYRNKGIGTSLIKELINWGSENKIIKKINLRVRRDNTNAIHVYKKLGFKEEGIFRKEFYCEGELYDLIAMSIHV